MNNGVGDGFLRIFLGNIWHWVLGPPKLQEGEGEKERGCSPRMGLVGL
jgi:hypothetical protein